MVSRRNAHRALAVVWPDALPNSCPVQILSVSKGRVKPLPSALWRIGTLTYLNEDVFKLSCSFIVNETCWRLRKSDQHSSVGLWSPKWLNFQRVLFPGVTAPFWPWPWETDTLPVAPNWTEAIGSPDGIDSLRVSLSRKGYLGYLTWVLFIYFF